MPAEEQVRAPLPVVTERLVGNILPSVSRPRSVREIGEGGVHMEVREAQAKKPACVFHQKYIPSTTCIRSMGQSTFTQAFKSADECVGGGTQWVAAF